MGIDFDWSIDKDSLCIADDCGNGKVEDAAEFVRELMRLGYVLEPVAIQWADTCSKARPDAFTGGAAIATRRGVQWIHVPEIIEWRIRTIDRRAARSTTKRA